MAPANHEHHGGTSSHSRAHSDSVCVEVLLFPCGHGDTILLRFPGNRWALIDCYLPDNGTRKAFFDFVEAQGIQRLEWIFQTHPDLDHFFGMTDVLDYFSREERSLGCWCDSGLNAPEIRELIRWGRMSETEYGKLQNRLDELDRENRIQFVELNDRVEPISPDGFADKINIQPIGPRAWLKRRSARKDIGKFSTNPNARFEANDISVVLLLLIRQSGKDCDMLIPGDAGADVLSDALGAWSERTGVVSAPHVFDVIKVPHHGSKASHSPSLCKSTANSPSRRIAAISAGTRNALPDREVLRDYISEGWTVVATTTRKLADRVDSPLFLAGRRRSDSGGDTKQHLIRIHWSPSSGLEYGPPESTLGENDLPMYGTASR